MTDINTQVDLDTLQAAIESDIQAAFPSLQNVEFYSDIRSGMPLPACLLELSEWEAYADPDPGTEQQAVLARFEARLIIRGVHTKQSKKAIRALAAAFVAWLRLRRWTNPANTAKKLPTGPAEFLTAEPDHFAPEADQYECWRIEWQQVIHLGATIWTPGEPAPATVSVSERGDPPVQIYP